MTRGARRKALASHRKRDLKEKNGGETLLHGGGKGTEAVISKP